MLSFRTLTSVLASARASASPSSASSQTPALAPAVASTNASLLSSLGNQMFSHLIAYIILAAALLLLFNVFFSGFFLATPPRGDRAMIIVVPMLGTILASLLLLLASIIAGSRSGTFALGIIHPTRGICITLALFITLGICLGCFSTFIAWANNERAKGSLEFLSVASHWLSGIIAPLILALALLITTTVTQSTLFASPILARAVNVVFIFAAALSTLGYLHVAGDLYGAFAHHRKYAPYGTIHQLMPDEYVRQRIAGQTTNIIATELPMLGPDAPLWNLTALLIQLPNEPLQPTSDLRLVLDRAANLDDLDAQLAQTLFHTQPILRRGVLRFIASAPNSTFNDHAAAWAMPLQLAIDDTTNSLSGRPEWSVDLATNPDPVAYIADLTAAAQRFRATPHYPAMKSSLMQLSLALSRLSPSPQRDQMLQNLRGAGIP